MVEFNAEKTNQNIDKAFDSASVAGARNITSNAMGNASKLEQELTGLSPEALNTGQAVNARENVFRKANTDITNLRAGLEIQKLQQKQSSEQYLQNLTAQGILDPTTGNFLRSSFDMTVELEEMRYDAIMKQNEQSGFNALASGLGTLAGFYMGGPAGASAGAKVGAEVVS